MTCVREHAGVLAAEVAERLASPERARDLLAGGGTWWPQSLAHGAAGVALLHIERARTGCGPWQRAHAWLAEAAHGGITSAATSHLHYGAPALAIAMGTAAQASGGYANALDQLDTAVTAIVRQRLAAASARRQAGELPVLAEFDAIRGLAGLGAYLLTRTPSDSDLLREVLTCLVALTRPLRDQGETVPGWWAGVGPAGTSTPDFPGGHGNLGMAHGVAGPLALLAHAQLRGITVAGHVEAIAAITSWLDDWRQHGRWSWWPYWITRAQQRGEEPVAGPRRPSWCYGSAGLARAQHLAARALGDHRRAAWAEHVLAATLTDPAGIAGTVDASLCHGYAGLAHITRRMAAEAATEALHGLPDTLLTTLAADPGESAPSLITRGGIGLLEGAAGTALALHTAATDDLPTGGWDAFLLI